MKRLWTTALWLLAVVFKVSTASSSSWPAIKYCDFENVTLCGFTQDKTDDLDWTRWARSTPSVQTGPYSDHTYGRYKKGYYMYLNSSTTNENEAARLNTFVITGPSSDQCLTFWYSMAGSTMGTLNVYVMREGSRGVPVWHRKGHQGPEWYMGHVSLAAVTTKSTYQIVFEGLSGSSWGSDMAIDDLSIVDCVEGVTCNFDDESLCSWYNDENDEFDWTLHRGSFRYSSKGPSSDHTTGEGAFATTYYTPLYSGKKGRLLSWNIPASNKSCLHFWYYINGKDMGSLLVYSQQSGANPLPLWEESGDKGNQWNKAQVKIPPQTGDFKIIIEAISGKASFQYKSLDDIRLDTLASCTDIPLEAAMTTTTTTVPTTQSTRPTPKPSVTCNFDDGLCGWSNDNKTDKFNWTLNKGRTSTYGTGPDNDHTSGTGSYVYIESGSPRVEGDNARLLSMNIPASNTTCLHFWYHMYGKWSLPGRLRVYSQQSGSNPVPLWEVNGNWGNRWIQAQIKIPPQTKDFKIILEGVRGPSYQGDIGLDDIKMDEASSCARMPSTAVVIITTPTTTVTTGTTTTTPTTTTVSNICPEGQFMCSSYQCIEDKHLCDGTPDCDNAKDEDYCDGINCTFETGYCRFTQDSTDDLEWTRETKSSSSSRNGPGQDHTTGPGFFLTIDTSTQIKKGQKGRLLSHLQKATDPNGACLTFWYTFGDISNTLTVYIQTGLGTVGRTPLWTRNNPISKIQWQRVVLQIDSQQPYKIVFEGKVLHDNGGDIYLDDISLVRSPCSVNVCDFELGTCGYTQDGTEQLDWVRMKYGASIGVYYDHTMGTRLGYYMNMDLDTQTFRQDGYTGIMTSPVYPPAAKCLSFWSQMYGAASSWVKLHVYILSQGVMGLPSWTKKFVYRDENWRYGALEINMQNTWQIVFKGDVLTYRGGIALDDVTLVDGACPAPGSCTFEYDTCGYYNDDPVYNYDVKNRWVTNTGPTLSIGTGPSVDHTTGSNAGIYMYAEASNRKPKYQAWLYSQPLLPTDHSCLSFWYYMYGKDMGSLKVYQGSSLVLNATGNQGEMWINRRLDFSSISYYRMLFLSELGASYLSDIAIDDIFITPGPCNATTALTYADVHQVIHLQCSPQAWSVTVDIRNITRYDIYMGTPSCTGTTQGHLLVFNSTYDQCGTHAEVKEGNLIFSNSMTFVEAMRVNWEYNIQCTSPVHATGTVQIVPALNDSMQGASSQRLSGSLIDISVFKDANFRDPLRGMISSGSPVYVQVVSCTPPEVVMVVDHCEAKVDGSTPSHQTSIILIENHCSMEHTTNILTVRSQLARFKFDMFHLTNDRKGINITCDVHFCDQTDLSPRCEQRCQLKPAVIG